MISVIIPALNEEKYIRKCLEGLKKQTFKDFEVIVVDGNSTDNTVKISKQYSKVVIAKNRGIGYQQNLGVKNAKGDILVFTQADVTFPPNILYEINKAIESSKDIVGGSTTGIFEPINYKVKLLNLVSPIIQKTLSITYGHCIFVRKDIFEKTTGFRNCICEACDFSFRLKKHGKVVILTDCSYLVSSRRFVHKGFYSPLWLWVSEYFKIKFGFRTPIEMYPAVR